MSSCSFCFLLNAVLTSPRKYIKGMECWAIGNIEWSFAIGRYFGNEHKAVRDSLIVQLYPRQQVLSAAL